MPEKGKEPDTRKIAQDEGTEARVKAPKFLTHLDCIPSAKRSVTHRLSAGEREKPCMLQSQAFPNVFVQFPTDGHLNDFQLLNRFLDLGVTPIFSYSLYFSLNLESTDAGMDGYTRSQTRAKNTRHRIRGNLKLQYAERIKYAERKSNQVAGAPDIFTNSLEEYVHSSRIYVPEFCLSPGFYHQLPTSYMAHRQLEL